MSQDDPRERRIVFLIDLSPTLEDGPPTVTRMKTPRKLRAKALDMEAPHLYVVALVHVVHRTITR